MAQKVTSTDIKLALKEFHNGKPSYFITECKTCSTYFPDPQGLLKFDGLAITKSYTKPNIIGYEIKVSRNDFLQDNKWHLYLQYCNEFYFVVPKGLVKKEELPDHVGLIYFNPDTKALRTVKKALYRQIEEPVGVYKYIIFSRLEEDRIPFYNDRAEYCKDYLEDKVVKSAIGQRLGTKLAKDLEEAENKLKSLQSVEKELQAWKSVKKVLDKAGILPWRWWDNDSWVTELEQRLKLSMYLGRNGAGKSTIIKCIMGFLKYQGQIQVNGLENKSIEAKKIMGYIPEIPSLYPNLTVDEHMEFIARAYKLKDYKAYKDALLERFDLTDKKKKFGDELSKGMQQKLSICCGLLPRPRLVLFDEPMIGLDPHAIKELKKVFEELRDSGCMVLVSTHMIDSMEELWDTTYIMKQGRVAAVVERENLKDNHKSLEDIFFEITEGAALEREV